MGLFEPAWMTSDPRKESKALDKIRNEMRQDQLARAALNAPLASVRIEAVDKLKDQEALFKAANVDADKKVRERAVIRISDQDMLRQLALSNDPDIPRALAAERITDQPTLEKIALDRKHPGQITALKKVKSQEVLIRAVSDSNSFVRMAIVSALQDEDALREMAYKDPDRYVRLEAAKKLGLTDVVDAARMESRIKNLLSMPKNINYKNAIADIESISDRSALTEIYSSAIKPEVRDLALERLIRITPDDSELADFLLNHELRTLDADKIMRSIRTPSEFLEVIKRSNKSSVYGRYISEKALEKLKDAPDMLYYVYDSCSDNKELCERAWELLVLKHKSYLEGKGLKKEADEADRSIRAKYEEARRQLDEVMDHIPD